MRGSVAYTHTYRVSHPRYSPLQKKNPVCNPDYAGQSYGPSRGAPLPTSSLTHSKSVIEVGENKICAKVRAGQMQVESRTPIESVTHKLNTFNNNYLICAHV